MSKSWIAYHNAYKAGMRYHALNESAVYTKAKGNPQPKDKMWVIEGIGKRSPKLFYLVDCFIVDTVDSNIPYAFKGMTKRIAGNVSLMADKLPINIHDLEDDQLLETLHTYLKISPSMTGAQNKLDALEALLKMAVIASDT